jgi:hypothetical protein
MIFGIAVLSYLPSSSVGVATGVLYGATFDTSWQIRVEFGMDNCMSTKSKFHSLVCCRTAVVSKMENALLKFVHRVTGTAFALFLMTQRSAVNIKTAGRCTALRDAPGDSHGSPYQQVAAARHQRSLSVLQISF